MTTLKQLRVVIASPSDVKEEREALDKVIDKVNDITAENLGLVLKAVRWETDSYPGFHINGPQGLIDPIIKIEDCDILICIFWKRFGKPIKKMVKLVRNMNSIKPMIPGNKIISLIL